MKHPNNKSHSSRAPGIGVALLSALCIALPACSGLGGAPGDQGPGKPISTAGTGGRPVLNEGADTGGRVVAVVWDDGEYGHVRIERAEDAAVNDHPVSLSPEQIRAVLAPLQVKSRGKAKPVPVFTADELDEIAGPLATALAKAQPSQDVTFAATGKPGRLGRLSLFTPRVVTTGRVFYKNGELNVVFGLVHGEFEGQLRATGVLRPFTPGSRDQPLETDMAVLPPADMPYVSAKRNDWIQIAPAAWSAAAVAPAAPAPAQPSMRSQAAPSPTRPVAGAESSEAQYQRFEARLKTLRKLRDSKLITEEEFQTKRRAILNEL